MVTLLLIRVESLCRDIDCSIQFHIKEKDSTNTKKWLLFLKASDIEKAVCQKVTSMDSRSDVLIRCADETFIDIVNQKLSPGNNHKTIVSCFRHSMLCARIASLHRICVLSGFIRSKRQPNTYK